MTTTDRSTVVGVFSDDAQAQQAINALRQAGFTDTVRHEEARIERTGDATIEENDTGVQGQ